MSGVSILYGMAIIALIVGIFIIKHDKQEK